MMTLCVQYGRFLAVINIHWPIQTSERRRGLLAVNSDLVVSIRLHYEREKAFAELLQ